jgi:hypothetical protein
VLHKTATVKPAEPLYADCVTTDSFLDGVQYSNTHLPISPRAAVNFLWRFELFFLKKKTEGK